MFDFIKDLKIIGRVQSNLACMIDQSYLVSKSCEILYLDSSVIPGTRPSVT